MKQYKSEVEALNQSITSFNEHLVAHYLIPEIDISTGIDEKNIVEILHGRWDDFRFPNSESRGVYFVFGRHRDEPTKSGVYIGKSSFDSAIGRRLYAWLHPHRSNQHFVMKYGQDTYILDYIISINLDKLEIPFMASALEEYLITSLTGRLNLLNGTGNSTKANVKECIAASVSEPADAPGVEQARL
jgi:hypothetical protein